jgi:UDP-2,3-diacylglucosamine pyrophosphatase LpxH
LKLELSCRRAKNPDNLEAGDLKNDVSKSEFKNEKHYSGVRMQQGRVLLDEDYNESAQENEKNSIIVVADTHFGLYTDSEACDPNAFADFLDWVIDLEEGEEKKLKTGVWSSQDAEPLVLEPPEKMIFLGDILELWTSSNEAVFASTISIIQSLSELNCEKIYVLGNHDYDLFYSLMREAKGETSYPLGDSDITVIEKDYWTEKGGENYCFMHGQQFDKLFALPSWKFMAPIRKAASAFGDYTWVLVALWLANFAFQAVAVTWGVAEVVVTALLTVISLPYLVMFFSRRVWNRLKTIKFNPQTVQKEYEEKHQELWERFSDRIKEGSEILNLVYGHTHTIDSWRKEEAVETKEGEFILTQMEVANVPSWIKNAFNEQESIENEISHVFLYITEVDSYFIGWDRVHKNPFLIPKDIIAEKRKRGNLSEFEQQYGDVCVNGDNLEQKLAEIDWPEALIKKWVTGFKIG